MFVDGLLLPLLLVTIKPVMAMMMVVDEETTKPGMSRG